MLTNGQRVRTVNKLRIIEIPNAVNRRPNRQGTIVKIKIGNPFFGYDSYDVQHDDGIIATYFPSELIHDIAQ